MSANAPPRRFILRSTAALPVPTAPPALAVAAGEVVHLVAMSPGNERAVHATLDRDGALASQPVALPISILALAACGDEAVVAGVAQDGTRQALCVNARGTMRCQAQLAIAPAALVWMVPLCVGGNPVIVWEVEQGAMGELGIAGLSDRNPVNVATSRQAGVAFGLDAAAIGSSVFVLRSRGAQRGGDVLRIERGDVTARAETAPNAHAIAAVGARLVVLAWTPRAVALHWLETTLAPSCAPEIVATAQPPSWIRYAALHAAGAGRIAVSYLEDTQSDFAQMPDGRSEPAAGTRQFLGPYDPAARTLTDPFEVRPAGTGWTAGAWLDDRFLFVHGTAGAALSVFDYSARE